MEGGGGGWGAQNCSFLVVVINVWSLTLVWNGNGLNRMLFGMPVSRYALITKVLEYLKDLTVLNVSYTFTFYREIIKKWNINRKNEVFPGCEKEGCYDGYQK